MIKSNRGGKVRFTHSLYNNSSREVRAESHAGQERRQELEQELMPRLWRVLLTGLSIMVCSACLLTS